MNYFVYVNKLIGVETNDQQFRWSFGSCAPKTTKEEYDACKIKVCVNVRKNKDVFKDFDLSSLKGRFRYFFANPEEHIICYSQKVKRVLNLNYIISVQDNFVNVVVGKTYYNQVRYRVMNIHSMRYILFDIVTGLLLLNGYSPLYCSSVLMNNKGATVLMAPPNMGKSLTALRLCQSTQASLISEDIAITDGTYIWPVPWTNSYRDYADGSAKDKQSIENVRDPVRITNTVILERGDSSVVTDKNNSLSKMLLLNHYLLSYMKSPAMSALAYFNSEFSPEKMMDTEKAIFENLLNGSDFYCISDNNALTYSDQIVLLLK